MGHRVKIRSYDQIKTVTILQAIVHQYYEWKANSLNYSTASKGYSYGYQVFSFAYFGLCLQRFTLKTDKKWHVVDNIMPFNFWAEHRMLWNQAAISIAINGLSMAEKITVPFSQQFCTLSLKTQLKQLFLWTNIASKV